MDRMRYHLISNQQQYVGPRSLLQPVSSPSQPSRHTLVHTDPHSFRCNRVYLYQTPAVSTDAHFGVSSWKLEMAQLSGELLNPMWKVLNPPSMLPTDVLHIKRYGLE